MKFKEPDYSYSSYAFRVGKYSDKSAYWNNFDKIFKKKKENKKNKDSNN